MEGLFYAATSFAQLGSAAARTPDEDDLAGECWRELSTVQALTPKVSGEHAALQSAWALSRRAVDMFLHWLGWAILVCPQMRGRADPHRCSLLAS